MRVRRRSGVGGLAVEVAVALLAIAVAAPDTLAAASGYAFSPEGRYIVVDRSTNQIARVGYLWDDVFGSEAQKKQFDTLRTSLVLDAVTDLPGNRIFLLVGVPKAERLYGYVVLHLDTLKFIEMLKQEMLNGPTGLAIDTKRAKLYLTYLVPGPRDEPAGRATALFDGHTYARIREYRDSPLEITRATCFLPEGDALYTNRRLFDPTTAGLIREIRLPQRSVPVGCEMGRLLLLSKATDQTAILTVFDTQGERVLQEIKTQMPMVFFLPDEWTLSKDARVVVRDEIRSVPVGQGGKLERTGTLHFLDAQTEAKIGEVHVSVTPDTPTGILAQSMDGTELVYRSDKKLFIVDLKKALLVKELMLPFAPVGAVWP